MSKDLYVVVFGSLTEGFEVVGPFEGDEAAYEYGAKVDHAGSWYVMPLYSAHEENV